MLELDQLNNTLDLYTVPDTMSNGKMDGSWFKYDTRLSRLFRSDASRNASAYADTSATWVPVDREKIISELEDSSDGRLWNYY